MGGSIQSPKSTLSRSTPRKRKIKKIVDKAKKVGKRPNSYLNFKNQVMSQGQNILVCNDDSEPLNL